MCANFYYISFPVFLFQFLFVSVSLLSSISSPRPSSGTKLSSSRWTDNKKIRDHSIMLVYEQLLPNLIGTTPSRTAAKKKEYKLCNVCIDEAKTESRRLFFFSTFKAE